MKKILTTLYFILNVYAIYPQCTVTAIATLNPIQCGDCVDINALGMAGQAVLNNDFNNGQLGAGWVTTPGGAVFTNPCDPPHDVTGTYLWMGNTTAGTREVATAGFDLSCGGQVCFYLDFATQGGAAPCEGPDIVATEGVYFEYSIDGGITWVTLNYFAPMPGGGAGPITSWAQYCFTIPPAAMTPNTMFHWEQPGNSGTCCDHWGIDDVEIFANDCGYWYDWSHLAPTQDSSYGGQVCPQGQTTYNVMYTNGINDTCTASITINILFPTVNLTATPNPITVCNGCTQLDATLTSLPPDSCCYTLDMQDSWGDGWNGGQLMVNVTNGPVLGPFSAVGTGSIVTFCVADGQTFTLDYTAGNFENENTYTLFDPNMTPVFNNGPNPAVGNVFTTTANCGGPAPNYVYTWSGPNLTAINDSTQTACPTVDSWYYVTVSGGGCSTTDSIFITASNAPILINEDDTVCFGGDYMFPDSTNIVNVNSNTIHVSNLVTPTGCDSIITTNLYVDPVITSTIYDTICQGGNYTFPDGSNITNANNSTTQISNIQTPLGCDSIVTTNLTVNPVISSEINTTVCLGDGHRFHNGDTITHITSQMTIVSNLQTIGGCDSTVIENVYLYPQPTANFNWNPNPANILNNTVYFTNLSNGATTYLWDFNGITSSEENPTVTYQDTGKYGVTLIVENQYGCRDTVEGIVIINDLFNIFIPNAFTPNGDGFNNEFKPELNGFDVDRYTLMIYNRWGELIFETYNYLQGWDGTYKGSLVQNGVYVVKIVVWTFDNRRKEFIGRVNLLR